MAFWHYQIGRPTTVGSWWLTNYVPNGATFWKQSSKTCGTTCALKTSFQFYVEKFETFWFVKKEPEHYNQSPINATWRFQKQDNKKTVCVCTHPLFFVHVCCRWNVMFNYSCSTEDFYPGSKTVKLLGFWHLFEWFADGLLLWNWCFWS